MSGSNSIGVFSVNGEGCRLTVEVLGYENLRPQTVSDANWLRTRVQFDAGGCALRIEAALTTQDVKYFLDELEGVLSSLEGSASLTTDEESIGLRVKVTKTGVAQVSGELKELGTAKVKVGFEFESDQSYLGQTLTELRGIHRDIVKCCVSELQLMQRSS
jgi:hypothetical protein